MRIAAVQIQTGPDILENLAKVEHWARKAANLGVELMVFPEATMKAFGTGRLDNIAEDLDDAFASKIRELAEELEVVIVLGMFCPADIHQGKNRIYNTALITGPGIHRGYQKIHTYDAFGFRESDTVKPGTELVVFPWKGANIGVAVCFDVRFPQQFQDLARNGAQVIVLPASWSSGPGKVEQWQLLTAARALDSTSFLIACDQALPVTENSDGAPTGVGRSAIIGPTGVRIAEANEQEEIIYADIDISQVERVRTTIPVL
ncbi:carbon-nitrogen hydrolase family protein [Corynebacterium freiburgense]|uniref:carbon-nitrogen hydrolase family protein n=1 Tax=Corynebacterium freiburgense TaxID=556548 RepID=UPI000422E7A6|nr:carbon-nitrogen hydrolase family protein [Corynebacterium freiburgense]WJZ03771.1 (R)-stereoselective amidase [Corynebacterium freiburgense]